MKRQQPTRTEVRVNEFHLASHVAKFMKLHETLVLISGNHRSQDKVSYQRNEAADEQTFNPTLTDSAERQGPTTIA